MSFAIVIDSTLEVSEDLLERVTIVPLNVTIGDLEMKDRTKTPEWMLQEVRSRNVPLKTSQPSPAAFKEVYEKLLKEHDWVLSIHISSGLSGTLQSARLAAESFGGRVKLFDTMNASIAGHAYVERALKMKDESPEKILRELAEIRRRSKIFLTVKELEFLRRGGRLKAIESVIGSVLKLKPIMTVVDGRLRIAKILVGNNRVIGYFKKEMERRRDMKAVIGYIVEERAAKPLVMHALDLGMDHVVLRVRSMVLAAHLGPGGYGVFFY